MDNRSKKKAASGRCKRMNPFRGVVTVSDKGQMVIPVNLMRELCIEKKSQLLIFKRDDDLGFVALKEDAMAAAMMEMIKKNNPL